MHFYSFLSINYITFINSMQYQYDYNSRGCFLDSGSLVLQWQEIPIRNAYKPKSVLTNQNADVAQTFVGVTYLGFIECVKTGNVLYMQITNTFA